MHARVFSTIIGSGCSCRVLRHTYHLHGKEYGGLWLPPILSMSTWGCMRAADQGRDDIPELTWVADEGQLWLSSVTMQGTGTDRSLAIDGFSLVHAESAPQPTRPCINPQSHASQLECMHAMQLGSTMRWAVQCAGPACCVRVGLKV